MMQQLSHPALTANAIKEDVSALVKNDEEINDGQNMNDLPYHKSVLTLYMFINMIIMISRCYFLGYFFSYHWLRKQHLATLYKVKFIVYQPPPGNFMFSDWKFRSTEKFLWKDREYRTAKRKTSEGKILGLRTLGMDIKNRVFHDQKSLDN